MSYQAFHWLAPLSWSRHSTLSFVYDGSTFPTDLPVQKPSHLVGAEESRRMKAERRTGLGFAGKEIMNQDIQLAIAVEDVV